MTKLLSVAALLLAVGCGAPPSTDETTGETEASLANGECYTMYHQCAERCGPTNSFCLCGCHNALADCTTPKGRLYKCVPNGSTPY